MDAESNARTNVHLDVRPIARSILPSPLGPVRITADRTALREILLPDEAPTGGTKENEPPPPDPEALEMLERARSELESYFAGRLRRFSIPLAASGTRFQEEVWKGLTTIPFGQTRSYGWLAERIGRPTACRAVGAANGRNPLPIVVPCHRVIGADGTLTGYGGGVDAKRWLLEHEREVLAGGSRAS